MTKQLTVISSSLVSVEDLFDGSSPPVVVVPDGHAKNCTSGEVAPWAGSQRLIGGSTTNDVQNDATRETEEQGV